MALLKQNKNTSLHIKSSPQGLSLVLQKLLGLKYLLLLIITLFPHISKANNLNKTIAITAIVEHPSLEEAKLGLLSELANAGYIKGQNLNIIENNAQGNIVTSSLIAKKFVSMKPDAIVAISTTSAQTVVNAAKGSNIPIVFSSVTDPIAAGLVSDLENPENNITGATDFPLIEEEIILIKTLMPNIKTLGLLYSQGESNSIKTISLMKEALGNKLNYIEFTVANSNQVGQAIEASSGKVEAIYIPSDNIIFSAMSKAAQLSRLHKIPLFTSDPASVKQGALGCIGYSQEAVGRAAGKLLVRRLEGEKLLSIVKPKTPEIYINKKTADILNIDIPEEILNIKTKIVGLDK